jgi:Uma2 family endonuclease
MQPKPAPLTPAQYLEEEEKRTFKCEYVDGEMYAMSGAKRRHNLIAANLVRQAGNAAAANSSCQVFGSDMKVYLEVYNSFYYPDVSVCCDPDDKEDLFLTRPCFIVEVLSPSTASIDRREKRASYMMLESLREYVIVDEDQMRVELYRRENIGWRGYILSEPDDIVHSSCLGMSLTLDQIYAGVEFPPTRVAEAESAEYESVTP